MVPLDGIATRGPVIRAANGRVLSSLPVGRRFSTFDLLNTERHALDLALRLLDGDAAVCHDEDLLAALRGAPTLSEEQRSAVIRMTTSGNGVDILTAPAGAGKTFALAAAREAWERSGYRVSGAAHTGVAADEITNAAAIPSTTIARLRIAIDNNEPGGLDDRTVLIIDEAGTAGTRDLAAILDEVERCWLEGRARRRPEAAPRDRSRRTVRRAHLPPAHDRTPRQPTPARGMGTRSAQATPRRRPRSLALDAYRDHGRITIGDTAADTKALLVADWWAARTQGDDAMMLAGRRSEVAELNVHGRLRAELAGQLTGDPLRVGGHEYQVGDAVMTLKNNTRIGVRNGNRGVVVAVDVDARSMRVRMPRGEVELPARYLDAGHVGHAYAMTVNKAHGLTCDRTMTLGNDQVYRELAYEALSRGRLSNHVYMPKSCTLDIEDGPHARVASLAEATETLDTRSSVDAERSTSPSTNWRPCPIEAWPTPELHAEKRRVEQSPRRSGPGPAARSRLTRGVDGPRRSTSWPRPTWRSSRFEVASAHSESDASPTPNSSERPAERTICKTASIASTPRSQAWKRASIAAEATSPHTKRTPISSRRSKPSSTDEPRRRSPAASPTRRRTS